MDKTKSTPQQLHALGALKPRYRFMLTLFERKTEVFRQAFPFPKFWPAILIVGAIFLGFLVPFISSWQQLSSHNESLFDLSSNLFTLFWLLGWSTGVLLLLVVLLALLFLQEALLVYKEGIELRLQLFCFGVSVQYPANRICRLRVIDKSADKGSEWRRMHLCFDYFKVPVAFGSHLNAASAAQLQHNIQQALGFKIPEELSMSVEYSLELAQKQARAEAAAAKAALLSSSKVDSTGAPAQPLHWHSPSSLILIAANLVPVFGVMVYGWNIGELFLLFWLESAIIGVFNVLKMLVIGRWLALFTVLFFVGHYGAFMAGHLLFIFGPFINPENSVDTPLPVVLAMLSSQWLAILALVVSHGFSFFDNFIGKQEYLGKQVSEQMSEPYKRIFVLHITIIFGGFLVQMLGSPMPALLLLVALKLAMDLRSHLREHRVVGQSINN